RGSPRVRHPGRGRCRGDERRTGGWNSARQSCTSHRPGEAGAMREAQVLQHDWFPRPLPANVQMGERSWCYSSFSCLHYRSQRPCGIRVGHDSGIYHGTFFELGPDGEVEIGNYCTLVGAIIVTNARLVIEDYAFLAHEVVLADTFAAIPPHARDGA